MKWFKHNSNLLDEPNMQHILSKHHFRGIYAYFKLMEIFADHFNPKKPGYFLENKRWILSNICPLKRMRNAHQTHIDCMRNAHQMLKTFQNLDLLEYKYFDKSIEFKCKIIKELADEYTQKIMKKK